MVLLQKIIRKQTKAVEVGDVIIGGGNHVVIQSMTNTPTKDIAATTNQIIELHNAGSQIVRVTVNDLDAAKAVPKIVENLKKNLLKPELKDMIVKFYF